LPDLEYLVMLPRAKRNNIISMLEITPNAKLVATEIGGVSHATVCRIAKEAGIPLPGSIPPGGGSITDMKRVKIVEALKVNSNATQVAAEIGGVGCTTVWRIAREEGIDLCAGRAAKGKYIRPNTKRTRWHMSGISPIG
jgi:hypothetical protein